jgi:arylsulfatase A-like enzyme
MNAIVLVVDQLHAGYLGCYGNSWIGTPAVDRLASQGFLFDQALLESTRLSDFYHACWGGVSALGPQESLFHSLPALLREQQVQTALVSDNERIFERPVSGHWQEAIPVPVADRHERAKSAHDSQFARVFAAAGDWLAAAHEPFVLWTHFGSLKTAWDAPLEMRARYFEEEDLDIPQFIEPPRLRLADDFDPDEQLKIRWCYAAQVSLFDACLAEFLALIDTPELLASTAVILVAPRGYPLGEHRRVGFDNRHPAALHAESIHLPLVVRLPGQQPAAARSQALVQPADLHATLLEWFGLPPHPRPTLGRSLLPVMHDQTDQLRDHLLLVSGSHERGIRTPAWYLRSETQADGNVSRQLFVKPDDRWEANEVADRCPDIADELQRTLRDALQQAADGQFAARAPLAEVLVDGLG